MKRAIYPGSFDPVTFGHMDLVERSVELFDEIVVAVLNNSQKKAAFTIDERVKMLKELVKEYNNVTVVSFDGLLIDFAKKINANVIIRGLRAITDFDYELQIAQSNRTLSNDIDTVFLATDLKYSYLSSTVVKEFASYGADVSKFVPKEIIPYINEKYNSKKEK